jgi:hypothetical protein
MQVYFLQGGGRVADHLPVVLFLYGMRHLKQKGVVMDIGISPGEICTLVSLCFFT